MAVSALVPLVCFLLAAGHGVFLASAQSGWESCDSLQHYTELHPECFVGNYGEPCSELYCYDNVTFVRLIVQDCEDPVTVFVHIDYIYDYDIFFGEFQYVYNQSETVDNDGRYSYGDNGSYTAIMERNASHLGFELFVEYDDQDAPKWLVYPIYFPLDPADCMCSSMQTAAEDINLRTGYVCNTTNHECSNLRCDVYDRSDPLQSASMYIDSCANPPALELSLDIGRQIQSIRASESRTVELNNVDSSVVINLWHFDYSMDVELTVINEDTRDIILNRHKIILDLTECGPQNPLNISGDSTVPPTRFTEPTVPPTVPYDTCGALQSITVLDGALCTTNEPCDALECEISNQRLEMTVDSCHEPPGIRLVMYDSANRAVFKRSFYNGSSLVSSNRLPFTLNVTVKQLPPSAISVEIFGEGPLGYRIPIVPKTVIPIDKSSCTTLQPTTSAPSGTCSAMQYIQSSASRVAVASCYFPLDNNCSVLTCPVGDGLDVTLSILRCANPPAIRITYGNGFFTLFDHTFDHSEAVPIEGDPNHSVVNVTLDHLCPSDIGLKVDINTDTDNYPLIPYTVIPINTTGCGVQSGLSCPSVTPTRPGGVSSTHNIIPKPTKKPPTTARPSSASPTHGPQPTGGTEPPTATDTTPTTPSFGSDTCEAMKGIAEQLNISLDGSFACVLNGCGEIDCNSTEDNSTAFNMILHCSPIAVEIVVYNYSLPKQSQKESKNFTESGKFDNVYVTIDDKQDDEFGFAMELRVDVGGSGDFLVNHTVIPVGNCKTDSKGHSGSNTAVLAAAIAVPVLLLLVFIAVVAIIIAVYTVKRRRYRHYQLHRMAMSQIDDEEC